MQRLRLHRNDVLLFLLAVVVLVGAVYTVKQGSMLPKADVSLAAPAETVPPERPSPVPGSTESATPTPTGTSAAPQRRVVLLGADLADPAVVATVTSRLGTPVMAATSDGVTPLPLETFVDLLSGPSIVVMQLPRASTSRSDALAAVSAIRSRAPGTKVVLVGPVRRGESYGSGLQALTKVVPVTYLDPLAEHWVTPATATALNDAEHQQLAAHLCQDLTPLLT